MNPRFSFATILIIVFSCQATKFCINCKYFIRNKALPDRIDFGQCLVYPKTDAYYENYFVTGEKKYQNYHFCSTARMSSLMCGQQGKNFVEKNTTLSKI